VRRPAGTGAGEAPVPYGLIGADFCPRIRPTALSVEIDGEVVIYDEERAAVHKLNPSASVIFSSLDGSTTVGQLSAELAEAFGLERDRMGHDVLVAVREFGAKNLLAGVEAEPDRREHTLS